MITPEFIRAIAPTAKQEIVEALVSHQGILTERNISSVVDICHFLGQCAAETSGFNRLEESLYYTTVKRIRAVWPSRFKSDADALPFIRQPQKLANKVYGGRYGNDKFNDGWLYRGSGCKQTTFKANYQEVERESGIPCVAGPQLLRSFPAALESAAIYWQKRNLGRFAAKGDVTGLTKAVQGGSGGLADRKTYTQRALANSNLLSDVIAPAPKPVVVADSELAPKKTKAPTVYRNGSSGDVVMAIQQRLFDLGYRSVGRIDGKFGDATEDAVKLFQQRYGLVSDGVVGLVTYKALNAAKKTDYRDPPPLPKSSGLNSFLLWVIGLFRSIFERS